MEREIIMSAILSLGLGYLLGCLNPAAYIGKRKNVDLSKTGTKNLGATNTALVLGQKAGWVVLFFDMMKSILSYKAAKLLFPQLRLAGLIAGLGVLLGHCFPITMGFVGGKGLASFGGLVLVTDPLVFCVLLTFGLWLAWKMNYGVYLAVSATVLFPIAIWLRTGDVGTTAMTAAASLLIFVMHWGNFMRAVKHEDPISAKGGLQKIFGKKK